MIQFACYGEKNSKINTLLETVTEVATSTTGNRSVRPVVYSLLIMAKH